MWCTSLPVSPPIIHYSVSLFFNLHLRTCLLILERAREGEKHQCERETLISCLLYMPDRELNLQLRHVPWLGIEPTNFWFSKQLSYTSQGHYSLKKKNLWTESRMIWGSWWWNADHGRSLLSSPRKVKEIEALGFVTGGTSFAVHLGSGPQKRLLSVLFRILSSFLALKTLGGGRSSDWIFKVNFFWRYIFFYLNFKVIS